MNEELVQYGHGYRPRCDGVFHSDPTSKHYEEERKYDGKRCSLELGHQGMCIFDDNGPHFFECWTRRFK